MIAFTLNNTPTVFDGDGSRSLLSYLRNDRQLTAAKDGCSAQAACGACLVEVDGKAVLSCVTPMNKVEGKRVTTLEGLPESLRRTLGEAFVKAGAVQCGFCTPGFLTRARLLLLSNPSPTRAEVTKAVRPHLCRCTGYVKLVDAVLLAAAELRGTTSGDERAVPQEQSHKQHTPPSQSQGMGASPDRFKGYERAVGQRPFVDDLIFDNMLHGALHFSQYPRARIVRIDVRAAESLPGVRRVLTARDIPGQQCTGLHMDDWPLYVSEGQITRCIGDVLACVLADTVEQARAAADAVRVEYEELPGIFDMDEALTSPIHITPEGNILKHVAYRQSDDVEAVLAASAHVVEGYFETPPVEHAFLEPECSVALPRNTDEGKGVHLYTMSQGIWHDRHCVAKLLGLPDALVQATLVDAGGGFGGKEDLTTQGHAALGALLMQCPVKVKLSRPESLRMHPKRHATRLRYRLGCDEHGKLTALHARILGDSGAYASAGGPVMGRAAVHAAGAYHFPHQDVESLAVYTNNPPAGAFRGFGVNQVTFAVETLLDDLCEKGGFDRWQLRYDNALTTGGLMPTGQRLKEGMSNLRACLEAVKPQYDAARDAGLFPGLACGIKNTGFGNGIPEECRCIISVDTLEDMQDGAPRIVPRIVIDHGWTEMGQGVHTVARQLFCEVTGFTDAARIHIRSRTESGAFADATTASRGSFQLGHAVLRAAESFKKALDSAHGNLDLLVGHSFSGDFKSVTARAPQAGQPVAGPVFSHEAYSFAAHLVLCNSEGRVTRIVAAHDSGRPINRLLYEGQVEGGVIMGLGYALREKLVYTQGQLNTEKLHALGLLRSTDIPDIDVIIVEGHDPRGPRGVKGLGEITCIPTAPAVTSALRALDGVRRTVLPVEA